MTGRWIPYIGDTDVINKSFGNLLGIAKERMGKPMLSVFRDDVGLVAFEVDDAVVVAKKYIYGWIVSAHKVVIADTKAKGKKLVMFIGDADAFYRFDPQAVLDSGRVNMRGESEMLNFDIKLGERYLCR